MAFPALAPVLEKDVIRAADTESEHSGLFSNRKEKEKVESAIAL